MNHSKKYKKSVIGITATRDTRRGMDYVDISNDYVQSVVSGGGLPLVLPLRTDLSDIPHYAKLLDGLLMTGGAEDVHPLLYGENPVKQLKAVMPERDAWETALLKAMLEQDKPVLAVCRGLQLMNVAFGGSLYQHLPSQVKDVQGHYPTGLAMHYLWHDVTLEPDSRLHELFGKSCIQVNSFHNQAVKTPAPGFKICARSDDAVVEALESTTHRFALGVQWHPETLTRTYPEFIPLFAALVKACRIYP